MIQQLRCPLDHRDAEEVDDGHFVHADDGTPLCVTLPDLCEDEPLEYGGTASGPSGELGPAWWTVDGDHFPGWPVLGEGRCPDGGPAGLTELGRPGHRGSCTGCSARTEGCVDASPRSWYPVRPPAGLRLHTGRSGETVVLAGLSIATAVLLVHAVPGLWSALAGHHPAAFAPSTHAVQAGR